MRIIDSFRFGVYDNPLATRYVTARSSRTGLVVDLKWMSTGCKKCI